MSDFIVEKLTKSVGDKTVFKEISFIIHDFSCNPCLKNLLVL